MALIDLLPGMGGSTGALVKDSISLLENAAACGPEDPISCFVAIVDLALVVFDIFQTFFPSRPKVGKDSASDDTALFFIPSSNPIIALWGIGIRDLETQGIPTSASGGVGYADNLALGEAVLKDLKTQFDGPLASKVLFNGLHASGALVFQLYHQLGFVANHPDSNATAIHERIVIDQWYTTLVTLKIIDPTTGFPFKTPPPPPTCPAGQHWDAVANKCVPDVVIPPSDPDQDEFQDCCDETQVALAKILNAMTGLSGGGDPACCTNVIAALGALGNQLRTIALNLSHLGAGGVDLGPAVTELTAIATALRTLTIEDRAPLQVHITNSTPLATATATAPPIDVSGIVQQLVNMVGELLLSPAVIEYLQQQGWLTAQEVSLFTGNQTPLPGSSLAAFGVTSPATAGASTAAPGAAAAPAPGATTLPSGLANLIGVLAPTLPGKALIWILDHVGIKYDHASGVATVGSIPGALGGDVEAAIGRALKAPTSTLTPIIGGLVRGVVNVLNPATQPTLGNSGVDFDTLLTKTLTPALAANLVTWALDFLGWDVAETLAGYVEKVSEFTGLAEVAEVQVGTRMNAGPIAAARLQAQRIYRQSLPGAGQVTSWVARGIMPHTTAAPLLALGGWQDSLQPVQLEAATSGISARQLIRLLATGLFTAADIDDELIFSGMRPRSRDRYKLVAPYLATQPQRTQLISALEAEYSAGLMTDVELTDAIDSAEHNTDRNALILARVHAQERTALAKAFATQYADAYLGGLIDHATYTANLSGIGLQQWKIDALAGVQDAKRGVTLQRQMAAAERTLVRATAGAERKTAIAAFVDGYTGLPGLETALLATGLTPAQTAAMVTLAGLKKAGALRWIYGVQLHAAQATLLKERVSALTDQLKKGFITPVHYVNELNTLKIPPHWVNGLLATAEAQIAASKGGQLVAVQTN